MRLDEVVAWVNRMRAINEADIPYMQVDGKLLTPNDILNEAKGNTPLWQKIQQQLGDPPANISWDLLEKRLEEKIKKGRVPTIYTIGGKLTPEEQLKEIKNKTTTGWTLLLAEAKLLEELEKRRKHARQ